MTAGLWDSALWDLDIWGPTIVPVAPAGQPLSWFGGPIEIRVEIATALDIGGGGLWGSAEWDSSLWGDVDPEWFDITPYALGVETFQGAQRWGERFSAGSGALRLDNTTGIFTPESGSVIMHLPFRPGRGIRIVAIPDRDAPDNKIPLWTGFVDDSYDSYGDGFELETNVSVVDRMAELSEHDPLALVTPTGVQLSSDRVNAALDRISWPLADRDIQTGEHNLQSSLLADSTLEECQTAADAEGGAFYFSPAGIPTFKARDWLTTDTRSTLVQGFIGFTEAPGNQAVLLGVSPSRERARIVNSVKYARVGSTLQTAEDLASIEIYGPRTQERTDLENASDVDVLFLAERTLAAFKDSRLRIDSATISALEDPLNEDLNRLMWDSRIGDRIALRVATGFGWEFELETHIMGIAHSITADDWLVTFRLDDAQA